MMIMNLAFVFYNQIIRTVRSVACTKELGCAYEVYLYCNDWERCRQVGTDV